MSFASKVKSEICTKPISQRCCARAELAGIIEFGGRIDVQQIRLTTENPSVAKRSYSLFKFVYGVTPITYTHKNKTQKSINMYYTELSGEDAVKIKEDLGIISNIRISEPVIRKECCKRSYIKGAFLGSGSVSDPEKGYHLEFVTHYGLLGLMTALPTTPSFMDYEAVYLPKNHFIKAESMETEDYLALFYPFDQLDLVKKGIESRWSVSGDNMMVALTMTFASEPMAKTMSFQREYAEAYDWVAQQFKDWAFTLTTSILYYNDYDLIDEDTRNLYRKGMAAFGGIAPSYHIELLDKPTIYWDFHSLLLGIQMMFSFLLVDGEKPLRLCKHCQKVFLSSRSNSAFCSPRCKNQYNVYKTRAKSREDKDNG